MFMVRQRVFSNKLFKIASSFNGMCTSATNNKSPETCLLRQLQSKIKFSGPITVADYMKEVLTNPNEGYYMQKDVFGTEGDFITSPEISQIFGELTAIWLINEWKKMGLCKPMNIVELGPGRGTLADDILRVVSKFPELKDSIALHLVEVSPHLRKLQSEKLCGIIPRGENIKTKYGIPIYWYNNLKEVPAAFSCFVAHEFFDALPTHKFAKTDKGWREVLVDIDNGPGPHHLRFILSRSPTPASKLLINEQETKTEIEICPQAGILAEEIALRIKENGGCALIADYGHLGEKGDTFRAFRNHNLCHPLSEPGCADLTTDVDFKYMYDSAVKHALPLGPITQEHFLRSLKIDLRMEKLFKNSNEKERKDLKTAYEMLVSPEKMGHCFHFFTIFPQVMQDIYSRYPPTGFENSVT